MNSPVHTVPLVANVRAAVYPTAAPGRYLLAVEEYHGGRWEPAGDAGVLALDPLDDTRIIEECRFMFSDYWRPDND